MGRLKLQSNPTGTGDVVVTVPSTSGNFTITMPAETGTLLTTGTENVTFSGDLTVGNITVDSSITVPNASIAIGKLNTTGTASGSTYLRGDGAWSTVTLPSTDFGGVGSYAMLIRGTNGPTNNAAAGGTVNGSDLRYNWSGYSSGSTLAGMPYYQRSEGTQSAARTYNGGGSQVSGTWRKMDNGWTFTESYNANDVLYIGTWWPRLYVRIS